MICGAMKNLAKFNKLIYGKNAFTVTPRADFGGGNFKSMSDSSIVEVGGFDCVV